MIGQVFISLDELADEVRNTAVKPLTKAYKLKNSHHAKFNTANPIIYLKLDILFFSDPN